MEKIYIKNEERLKDDTLYKFLVRALRVENHWSIKFTSTATYSDLEFKELQCKSGKSRSFDDIIKISKTYFKVSDKHVAKVIIRILNENNRACLILCDSVHKWVVSYDFTKVKGSKYCSRYNDGEHKRNEAENGKYSYNDILTLAGLEKE